ncbi:hypothetical protein KEM55_000494, partial [Ascosphaera atra]
MRASYHLPTAVDFTNHLVNYIEVVPPDTRAAATLPAAPVAPADSAATTPDTTATATAAANTTTLPLARRDFAPTKKSSSTTATTKATAVSQNTQRLESVRKAGTVSREEQGAVEDDEGVKGTGRPEPVYPPSAPTMVPVRSPDEAPDMPAAGSVPPPSAPLEPTRAEGYVGVAGQTIPTAPAPAPEQQQATYVPTEQAAEEEEEDEPAGDTRVIIPPLLEDVDVDEDCPTYRRAAQV